MLVFTVSGGAATNYASDFANAVAGLTPTMLSEGGTESTVAGAYNIINPLASTTYTLSTGDQYTYVAVGSGTTIVGSSGGGDDITGGALLTYDATGDDNKIVFTGGNNTYNGSTVSGVGGDTVSAGSGYDTINTGFGHTTVFSGTGNTLINLNDTTPGDVAALAEGNSTVYAMGVADTVFASATGTIYGGAGSLTFVATGTPLPVSIIGGTGADTLYGTSGSDITFSNAAGSSLAQFIAGGGNETLNGAGAAGGFAFFGSDSDTSDSITGGSGGDYFSTGAGSESITAGSGAALFEINTVTGGATITINDFSAADSVNFAGLSVADETSLLGSSSTVTDGSLTVTLGDGTKVEFVGVTSLTGHIV